MGAAEAIVDRVLTKPPNQDIRVGALVAYFQNAITEPIQKFRAANQKRFKQPDIADLTCEDP
jgi:hypothetical protein